MCNKFFFFFVSLLVLSCSVNGGSSSEAQMIPPAMYVFGDSLVDVGNNNYLPVSFAKANFPHNGIDFPTKKPTGRFCNGKNAVDLLAEKIGSATSPPYLGLLKKKATNSFAGGVSFASAGAGIFNGSDQTFGQSIPLTGQVGNYITVHGSLKNSMGVVGVEKHLSKSLFAIVIGSNDLFGYFGNSDLRGTYTPQQYVDLMLTSLNQLLKRLHMYGGRKFVMVGVGMIGCAPAQRVKSQTQECIAEANIWASKYNAGLKGLLQQLKMELKAFTYSYFDTFSVFQTIINNPSNYGMRELRSACCGLGELRAKLPCTPISKYCSNRTDHMFWDFYHPTEAIHRIMANYIFEGSSIYTQPINVKQLIVV